MTPTSKRLLELLSLLQTRTEWTGAELATSLDVSRRTIRHDMERLREIGYAIDGVPGSAGGYRLGQGGAPMPPLLLNTEEAIAVAIGLRSGVSCIIGGMEETALRALTKLEQMLPARHRRQVHNLGRYTVPLDGAQPVPVVDPAVLTLIANACDSKERIRFEYTHELDWRLADGSANPRRSPAPDSSTQHEVEPYLLMSRHHQWLLLGFDIEAADWEIYLVDALFPRTPSWGPRFTPRPLPESDLRAFISAQAPPAIWKHLATVILAAPATVIRTLLASAEATVEALDNDSCRAVIGGESLNSIAATLALLDVDFIIEGPPELVSHIDRLTERLVRSSGLAPRLLGKNRA